MMFSFGTSSLMKKGSGGDAMDWRIGPSRRTGRCGSGQLIPRL